VADIKEHATDGKQSVIGALMDLLIRKSLSENSELQKTQEEYSEKIKTLLEPYKTGPLSKVSKDITDILQKYYTELEASLSINEESISIPLPIPKAELNIKEGDHSFNIESMGHGVQRATIISLLQYLAIHNHKQSGESAPMNLVLGIEEPELYQHPSRQKQFFQVLKELTNGGISGVSGTVQIIYATHSPYFVELTSVNNISKIYKSPITGLPSETKAHKTTLNEIMQRVASAWGVSEDKVTEISNLAHISTCNPQVHEGFFARKVILVEGESDKAALETIATLSNKGDFVSRDISIISCGGKTLIDKPFAAFSSLNIPTIAIWDWDDDSNDSQTKNIALLKLCGADSDIKPTEGQQIDILENCAFFKTTLEACLKHDFGDGVFDKLIEEVGSSASLKKKDWQVKWPKRSFVIARALENAYKQGKKSSSIEKLLDKILAQ
jgi:predicted ATP-dependent endonuclease of OLD family